MTKPLNQEEKERLAALKTKLGIVNEQAAIQAADTATQLEKQCHHRDMARFRFAYDSRMWFDYADLLRRENL